MKHHLALDQAAFYCNLCMFRCTTREQLDKHVTSYKRHILMASTLGTTDVRRCLIQNPNPKPIVEGIDYNAAVVEDQGRPMIPRLDGSLQPQVSVSSGVNSQGLVTVQLPPAVLADLLSPVHSRTHTPTQPSFPHTAPLQYDPLRPSYTGTCIQEDPFQKIYATPVCSSRSESLLPSTLSTNTSAIDPVTTQTVMSSCTPSLRLPELSTNIQTNTPAVKPSINLSTLNTPESYHYEDPLSSKEEDIIQQILGTDSESQMAFSPVQQKMDSPHETLNNNNTTMTSDKECQTLPFEKLVEAQYAPLTSTLAHFEKTMEVTISKVCFGMETVTRATRHLGATLETMSNSMTNISRTLDRLLEEKKKENKRSDPSATSTSTSKRPREEEQDKENRKLKSVVNKKSNNYKN